MPLVTVVLSNVVQSYLPTGQAFVTATATLGNHANGGSVMDLSSYILSTDSPVVFVTRTIATSNQTIHITTSNAASVLCTAHDMAGTEVATATNVGEFNVLAIGTAA